MVLGESGEYSAPSRVSPSRWFRIRTPSDRYRFASFDPLERFGDRIWTSIGGIYQISYYDLYLVFVSQLFVVPVSEGNEEGVIFRRITEQKRWWGRIADQGSIDS